MASTLRRCLEKDLDEVLRVERESFTHSYDYLTFHHYLHDPSSKFIVAEEDERIVGYAIYTVKGRRGLIISIAVRPSYRGKGIGRSLLKQALQELSQRVEEVELQVGVNNRRAIEFYEDAGFQPEGVIRRYYPDGEDALIMKILAQQS